VPTDFESLNDETAPKALALGNKKTNTKITALKIFTKSFYTKNKFFPYW
jgi:hypothetical protein